MTPKMTYQAIQRLNELEQIKLPPDAYPLIREIRQCLQMPPSMKEICAKIPGSNNFERAAAIGVTKTALQWWISGKNRPDKEHMEMLSEITGVPLEIIRAVGP